MRRLRFERALSTRPPLVPNTPRSAGSNYFGDRSAVTQMLWEIRNREQERLNPADLAKALPTVIVDKPHELHTIMLPFETDQSLRAQYISPFGHVRIGRLLEDLDAFAGNVAFAHVDDGDPTTRLPTLVTASVDKLDLIPKAISPHHDLKLTGGVTYVGSSSMEIRIDAFQRDDSTPEMQRILTTFFTFVALNPITMKPHRINRLVAATSEEKEREAEGARNKAERLRARDEALHHRLPTHDELTLVHQFFIADNTPAQQGATRPTTAPVPMAKTHQRSMIFCSHQQRNIHNKIFGGYLMRKAFELAFSTAYLFAGRRPYFSALGDITFNHPVEIGSLLDLRAAVVYTERNDIQVHVTARVHNAEARTCLKTNDFAFSFDLFDDTMAEVEAPLVRPESYAEAMSYVEGRRNLRRHRELRKQ